MKLARSVNLLFLGGSLSFFVACFLAGYTEHPLLMRGAMLLIYAYLLFSVLRQFVFALGALVDKMGYALREIDGENNDWAPFVSIIVPAFNEGEVIGEALKSLFAIDYPHFEVIVVDDGSQDNTSAIAEEAIAHHPHVPAQVLVQPNGGKASALNYGLRRASGDLIFCVDADSRIEPQSLRKGVRHFKNPQVAAVAGFVEIARTNTLLLLMQQLEYMVALNFARRMLSIFGAVPVVPGPVGLFRRDALLKIGGYRDAKEIFAEDAELSIRLLAAGWKIVSEEDMIAYTEAPESVPTLLRQRYRWNRGLFQATRVNFDRLVAMPGIRGKLLSLYLLGETLIIPLVNVGLTIFFLSNFLHVGDVDLFTIWFGAQIVLEGLMVILACHRDAKLLKWLGVFVLSKFSYAYVLIIWSVFSLFEEWSSVRMSWDKLDRTGQIGEAA